MTGYATFKRARMEAIERNRAYMADLKARTVCAHCGAQPVDWHNPEHVELNRRRFRIGTMAGKGQSIAAIESELARCTPLCRRCHMAEDGRLAALASRRPGSQMKTPARPCAKCQRPYKPLRKGLCASCYGGQPERLARRRALRASQRPAEVAAL